MLIQLLIKINCDKLVTACEDLTAALAYLDTSQGCLCPSAMADFSKLAFRLLNHPAASRGNNSLSVLCGGARAEEEENIPKQETLLKSKLCKNKNRELNEIM